ncbi:hypothetical protein [Marinobacter sp. UBA3607]|uniref:hypothetical protein n=1 Tax=Marinobacter sp. UBA3607 TaxID=1946820 RepID=UPI00257A3BA8|nr:hypothetical protein [Marinobacter sp. UBA3607]
MPDSNLIRAFLQQASASGSKSTVLKPLGWMMLICVSATLSSAHFSLPVALTYLFAAFSCITMALYLVAYLYCLFKDRDALRSETYSIQKMAIEKGFVGDDVSGELEVKRDESNTYIEGSPVEDAEDDK